MKNINILHLSDLHLTNPTKWDHERILNAVISDLKRNKFSIDAPDIIVFSGDLAMGASEHDAYSTVLEFLLRVLDATGLTEDRLIICPGNHDVDRRVVGANLNNLERFRNESWTYSGANALVDDASFKKYVTDVFSEYNMLTDALGNASCSHADMFSANYYMRDLGVVFVTFNTALLSAGGLHETFRDQGKLFVSEKTVVTALKRVPTGITPILIGHHPTSWFSDENQSIFERSIAGKALMYLSGHLHEVAPRQTRFIGGEILNAQSGALFCGRKRWNGYSIISLSTGENHSRIAYRRWFEHRLDFSKAEDIGDDGVFFSSEAAKTYWKISTPTVDMHSIDRWREAKLLPFILAKCNDAMGGSSFETMFVTPDFDREIPYRTEGEARIGSKVEKLSLSDIVTSKHNYVVSASLETGKSTLLRKIALIIARTATTSPGWTLPVIIQFGAIRNFAKSIERLIRDQIPDLEIGITYLLENGLLTVLVDDMDFNIKGKKKALVDFISEYPKCRYILASSTTFVEVAALQPEIVPEVPFTRIRMRPFRKGHLQTLVEKHGLTDPRQVDQMVERVMRDASALNVPLTAVTGTFLIQIIREEPDVAVVNQAALIERYLEMLLQKYAPRELLPGTFDFKNKVDLLCNVAEIMTRSDEYDPDENDLISWCIQYLKDYGLKYSAADLVNYFVESRILERNGGRVRFRLRMFFEFFTASRMIDSEEFREYIFSEERYLSFINEIGFYSALNRRDKNKMEEIFARFSQLTEDLWPEGDPFHDANACMETMALPGKDATEEELNELRDNLHSPEQVEDMRKELNEGTDFVDDNQSQSVIRKAFNTPGEQWVGHLLLLSGMVKHMELIRDADKRRLLSGALEGWVRFTVSSLGIIPDLAKNKRVVFNGVTYKSTLSDNLPVGEVARRLTLYMPIAVARMATTFIGTEKLRLQLEAGIGDRNEPLAQQLLRTSILSDLGVSGLAAIARKTAEQLKDSTFLKHVYARKMYEVAVRFRLEKDELAEIRDLVGNTFVQLNNVPRIKQVASKNSIIKGMSQQRIQVGLEKKSIR